MKKSSILFSSYMHGNMESLIQYYDLYLKDKYEDKIEIKYLDQYNIDKMSKIPRYFFKSINLLKRYHMVVSDYASPILYTGKISIFMDHGYGLKNMPGKDEMKDMKTIKLSNKVLDKVDTIVTLSKRDEKYFYKMDSDRKYPEYLPLGQPRNDVLFDKNFIREAKEDIKRKFGLKNEKIILYAPTWRGYDSSYDFPLNRGDFEHLNDFLIKNNWVFLYRPHYIENIISNDLIYGLKNIKIIDTAVEPHTQKILCAVDMVITDYSSIIVDFLVRDKPIAFIPYDLNKYDNFRGLVVDFNNDIHTPGPKISKVEELIDYISEIDNNSDSYSEKRELSKKYYYTYFDPNSCERVWKLILKKLGI